MTERKNRKVRIGTVVSDSPDKTVTVEIIESMRHSRYTKTVQRRKRLPVHDEANEARVGDMVRIMETRPISKTKRWRVVEIVERAR